MRYYYSEAVSTTEYPSHLQDNGLYRLEKWIGDGSENVLFEEIGHNGCETAEQLSMPVYRFERRLSLPNKTRIWRNLPLFSPFVDVRLVFIWKVPRFTAVSAVVRASWGFHALQRNTIGIGEPFAITNIVPWAPGRLFRGDPWTTQC